MEDNNPKTSNNVLALAEGYLENGWSLIPIIPQTKSPAIRWSVFQERRPTLEEVKSWISNGWYLAVVTGDISGLTIIDDDRVKHGLNEWGFKSPVCSKTQSNGRHYFFKYDRELHSHTNTKIHVDLKGWHSYCLLPPFNGREWIGKPTPENVSALPPIPDEVVRLINSDTKTPNGDRKPVIVADHVAIPDGGRNDLFYRVACSLFRKESREVAIQILRGINQTYFPPLSESEFQHQVSRAKEFVSNKITIGSPHTYWKNVNANGMVNGGYKQKVNFELAESKLQIIENLKKCSHLTSPKQVAAFLEEFFKEYDSKPGHWLYIVQHWNPLAINRTFSALIKLHESGRKTIENWAAFFTFLVKKRKKRRS